MATIALLLNVILFFLSVFNYLTIRKPKDITEFGSPVDVLIPVRNEEDNLEGLIASLKSQIGVPRVNFYFIDDSSTDRTSAIIESTTKGDERFHLITAPALPQGWIGKTWALQQGHLVSRGDITVTIDADVRLEKDALVKSLNLLQSSGLDFISPYPKQSAITFVERLIQPILQWSWMSTVPLAIAERSKRTSLAVANGQFFLVKRERLLQIKGFQSNSAQVLDDIELARALLRSGAKGTVVSGAEITTTRMYSSFRELRAGYAKSLWQAFGGKPGTLIAISFLFLTGIYPLALLMFSSPLGFFALELIIATRLISAKVSRGSYFDSFLHPLSCAVLIYLIVYSWKNKSAAEWKGRKV